jgi:hypothetical protein
MRNMASRTRSISLITINGKCKNQNVDLQLQNIEESQTDYFVAKKVRNFTTVELSKLKIFICLYTKGCFKITVSQSRLFKNIIISLENVMAKLNTFFAILYFPQIDEIEATISQIALKIYMEEGEKEKLTTKLSYNMLTQIFLIENNIIKLQVNQHQLTHSINWMNYEDCGSSSFYFDITDNKLKKIGGLKIYNNAKIILFIYQIEYLEELIGTAEKMQDLVLPLIS